jgi:hypothetical protein
LVRELVSAVRGVEVPDDADPIAHGRQRNYHRSRREARAASRLGRGEVVGTGPGATFVLGVTYFGPRRTRGTFERNRLSMTFEGWCFSIDDYARAFERAGFVIESSERFSYTPGAPVPPVPHILGTARRP